MYGIICRPANQDVDFFVNIVKNWLIPDVGKTKKEVRFIEVQTDDSTLESWMKSDADIVRELSNREWVEIVRSLADRLGPIQRTVFTLGCLEDYDNDEIADITGLDASQVKSNLYAAKQTIGKKLKEMGYE